VKLFALRLANPSPVIPAQAQGCSGTATGCCVLIGTNQKSSWPDLFRPSTSFRRALAALAFTWIRGSSPRMTALSCTRFLAHSHRHPWGISPDSPARKRESRISVTCPLFMPGAGSGPPLSRRFRGGDEPSCRSCSFTTSEGGPAVGCGSRRAFELAGTNKKLSRNFPRLADPVDHLDGQRSSAGKNFRCARA